MLIVHLKAHDKDVLKRGVKRKFIRNFQTPSPPHRLSNIKYMGRLQASLAVSETGLLHRLVERRPTKNPKMTIKITNLLQFCRA